VELKLNSAVFTYGHMPRAYQFWVPTLEYNTKSINSKNILTFSFVRRKKGTSKYFTNRETVRTNASEIYLIKMT